jgi:Na+/melibiose symporter-like transporter
MANVNSGLDFLTWLIIYIISAPIAIILLAWEVLGQKEGDSKPYFIIPLIILINSLAFSIA